MFVSTEYGIPDFVEDHVLLNRRPYRFDDLPMLREILADQQIRPLGGTPVPRQLLLYAGRQVTKSSSLAALMTAEAAAIPVFRQLYIAPLEMQASRFSSFYLGPLLRSPDIAARRRAGCVDDVFRRSFDNGSVVQLSYAGTDVERARGIPSDHNYYDEIQNLPLEHVPIIDECLAHSRYKFRTYAGTPKTTDNTIDVLWRASSQHEWVIACPACGRDNIPDREHDVLKMIQPPGLSCAKCGHLLDTRTGRWAAGRPERAGEFCGYHIPQIVLPLHTENAANWGLVCRKLQDYPPATFYNEVLGLSYDIGNRLLTLADIRRCCTLGPTAELPADQAAYTAIGAGVDWGIMAEKSFSVIVIGGIRPDRRVDVF